MESQQQSNLERIFEAVSELHSLEQIVTRETLESHTGIKRAIIDDRLKTLVDEGRVVRVTRGVFVPAIQHAPKRTISHTELPDGMVVLDIGDDVLKLTPAEARTVAVMLGARAIQASQIELGNQAAQLASGLAVRVKVLEKELKALRAQKTDKNQLALPIDQTP